MVQVEAQTSRLLERPYFTIWSSSPAPTALPLQPTTQLYLSRACIALWNDPVHLFLTLSLMPDAMNTGTCPPQLLWNPQCLSSSQQRKPATKNMANECIRSFTFQVFAAGLLHIRNRAQLLKYLLWKSSIISKNIFTLSWEISTLSLSWN